MMFWKPFVLLPFLCLACVMAGCSRSGSGKSGEEHPLFQKGRRLADSRDFDGAIEMYKQALLENPEAARPHLELALIYDAEKQEYEKAIYHYQAYLEANPPSDNARIAVDLLNRAKNEYLLKLLGGTPVAPPDELVKLQNENIHLKKQVEELQLRISKYEGVGSMVVSPVGNPDVPTQMISKTPPVVRKNPAPVDTPKVAQSAPPQTVNVIRQNNPVKRSGGNVPAQSQNPPPPVNTRKYQVQAGDTLSRIAERNLGSRDRWPEILRLNPGLDPAKVRPGQTLNLPAK